jgi:hypothetical protein
MRCPSGPGLEQQVFRNLVCFQHQEGSVHHSSKWHPLRQFLGQVKTRFWMRVTANRASRVSDLRASRRRVEQLAERMRAAEFTVASTHGGNSRQEQQACIAQFRSGAARLLIANDGLVRREMDAWWRNYVPLYINYDFPFNLNVFMLRLGQSGHFGRRCSAINFIKNDEEMLMLRDIQREFQISEIQPLPLNFYDYIM